MRIEIGAAQFRERFVRSFIDWVALSVLHRGPTGGHEIITSISNEYRVYVSPGSMYPILHNLEKTGLVASGSAGQGGKVRRVYTLTVEGRRAFLEGLESLDDALDSIRRSQPPDSL